MSNKMFPHNHWMYANEDGFDLAFIEAAHYDRDNSCQPMSLAQRPLNGKSNVEVYASTTVPVLAYPVLFCLGCTREHPCAYTHKIAADMGVCNLAMVNDQHAYVPSERVLIEATKSYTGHVTR